MWLSDTVWAEFDYERDEDPILYILDDETGGGVYLNMAEFFKLQSMVKEKAK